MTKEHVLKYLKQMQRFMNDEINYRVEENEEWEMMKVDDLINVRDGVTMAIDFLEKEDEKHKCESN